MSSLRFKLLSVNIMIRIQWEECKVYYLVSDLLLMTSYIINRKVLNICTVLTHCSQGGCIVLPLLLLIAINAFLVFLGSALVTFVEVSFFFHYLVCLPLVSDKNKVKSH